MSITCVRAAGPLPDDDVEFVVFERGVQLFFEDWLQAVDLVEEQTWRSRRLVRIAVRSPWICRCRPGSLLETDIELIRDDGGEGRLAQTRWRRITERDRALRRVTSLASSAIANCSLAFDWPMNSDSIRGRSFSSKPLSSSARDAETSRSAPPSNLLSVLVAILSESTPSFCGGPVTKLMRIILRVGVPWHALAAYLAAHLKCLRAIHGAADCDQPRTLAMGAEYFRLQVRMLSS